MIEYFKFIYENERIKLAFKTTKLLDKFVIKKNKKTFYKSKEKDLLQKEFEIDIDLNLEDKYELYYSYEDLLEKVTARYYELYKTPYFKKYNTDETLGAIHNKDYTIFRVWSPISKTIKVRIYNTGTPAKYNGDDTYQEYVMLKKENGVFELKLDGDLSDKYYTYYVENALYKKEIIDPYAKGCGINGIRGLVVDFNKTNPDGFTDIKIHEIDNNNMVVYESHIADLTSSKTWNGPEELMKTYKGFCLDNTSYKGMTTGFSHIKELGVNYVQLLPIFDAANDERIAKREFNWGYNPQNYNCLDGIYSTNPYDGYVRIREFKELVLEYNKAGINIIMDVVYNHVNSVKDNSLEILMPDYYFRVDDNGNLKDASACGNETASDHYMYQKFMIDSVCFFATEYKLAGFRFDLMGIHDTETMNKLTKALHDINPFIKVYGEPWAASEVKLENLIPANQMSLNEFDGYGCFNDKIRDSLIKGGLNDDSELGFVSSDSKVKTEDFNDLIKGINGYINDNLDYTKTVNYVTCHDNYTLYDRLKSAKVKNVKGRAILANSIILTSRGIAFILSGEEMLRNKKGSNNSYNLSYKINELNYNYKLSNLKLFEIYKKLIKLKTNSNLFDNKELVINYSNDKSVVYYEIGNYLIIHHNGVNTSKRFDLKDYSIYLDTTNSNKELTENYKLNKFQTLILYKNIEE